MSKSSAGRYPESMCSSVWQVLERQPCFAEFSYNNGYHASLKKTPFEVLYGRKCSTPLMWSEVGDCNLESFNFIKAAKEKIAEARENLRIAQPCQKSYADKRMWHWSLMWEIMST
jgi:hypothetical protein